MWYRKKVCWPADLHELRRIIRKTGTDQGFQWKEPDPEGAEFFSPAASVVSEDWLGVILINGWIGLTGRADAAAFFVVAADPLLVGKRDLRVRNHGSQEDRMGSPAFWTLYPADPEPDRAWGKFYSAPVVTMYREAGSVAAGTGQLMELKVINNRIIKGLRNLIAIPDKNGYHSIVNGHR